MTIPCSPTCTDSDVVTGLATIADQLHNLSAFLLVVSVFVLFTLTFLAVTLFVNGRTR